MHSVFIDFIYFHIVQQGGYLMENLKGFFGFHIEELTIVADTQVREALYVAMHQFLRLVVLGCFHRCKNLKRQGHSGIVQFL